MKSTLVAPLLLVGFCVSMFFVGHHTGLGQGFDIKTRLGDFDSYMEKVMKDWNSPGIGVGIVVKDKLVFAKGYGYRDYGKKLPVTPATLFQIASNTKLFTTMALGLLVDEGKIDWDKLIRQYVPSIQFYNQDLQNSVTIRDMLSHRTGISRHDMIWYRSDFTRKELFDRLRYLEPSQPIRQGQLYNNMMYVAAGYVVELLTHKTWEDFVRERLFAPLGMTHSVFSIEDMTKAGDYFVPYNEKRDTTLLYRIPYYQEAQAVGPAGSIISNINDMSKWLMALMNDGTYQGKQVIPSAIVKATLAPSIALPNTGLEMRGYREILNAVYGMGRVSTSYRGHYLAYHGGDLDGIHSQVSCMPYDSLGVIVFVIGDHDAVLYNVITYNIYERLLGMDQTPWSDRRLQDRIEGKKADRAARQKTGGERVPNAPPAHPLTEYAGVYENPAYGKLTISLKDTSLQFDFHKIILPLTHYHYERFDTPNDELFGVWSVNFITNPQGEIQSARMSLDENETSFERQPDASLADQKTLRAYVGKYSLAGTIVDISLKSDGFLYLAVPGQPVYQLTPYKPRKFRMQGFADYTFEFMVNGEKCTSLKQHDPSGEYEFQRKVE